MAVARKNRMRKGCLMGLTASHDTSTWMDWKKPSRLLQHSSGRVSGWLPRMPAKEGRIPTSHRGGTKQGAWSLDGVKKAKQQEACRVKELQSLPLCLDISLQISSFFRLPMQIYSNDLSVRSKVSVLGLGLHFFWREGFLMSRPAQAGLDSLCSPGWPCTCDDSPASSSHVQGLQACATMPWPCILSCSCSIIFYLRVLSSYCICQLFSMQMATVDSPASDPANSPWGPLRYPVSLPNNPSHNSTCISYWSVPLNNCN